MKKLLLIALAITATLPIATQTSGLKLKLIRPTYKKVVRKVVPIVAAMGVSLSFYLLYVLNLNKKTVAKLTTANANLTRSQTKEVSQTASTLVVELEKVRAANAQLANDLKKQENLAKENQLKIKTEIQPAATKIKELTDANIQLTNQLKTQTNLTKKTNLKSKQQSN